MTSSSGMCLCLHRWPLPRFSKLICRFHSAQESFINVIETLSPFYRLNADFDMDPGQWATDAIMLQRLSIEKHLVNTHGHYQILRLHRFYLNMAYSSQ